MSISIYNSIKELCEVLVKDANGLDVKDAMKIAFSAILFGGGREKTENLKNGAEEVENSVLEELEYVRFETKLNHDCDSEVQQYIDNKFDQYIEVYHEQGDQLENITKLLLLLRNSAPTDFFHNHNNFFQPAEFPKSIKQNPYLENFYKINLQNAAQQNNSDSFMALNFDNKYKGLDLESNYATNDCTFFSDSVAALSNRHKAVPKKVQPQEKEEFENESTDPENPEYSREILDYLIIKQREEEIEARLCQLNNFMWEVKYLNVGIKSSSFVVNDQLQFVMKDNVEVEGLSPDILNGFVKGFLEAGTCYKRLKFLISRNMYDFTHVFDGFVFRAFCYITEKFLAQYRKFIMSIESSSLLNFAVKTADMRNVLVSLTKMLKIHPETTSGEVKLVGSDFLAYLYKELINVTRTDVRIFYISVLKSCCDVYFSSYSKWLFQGYLEDPDNELFIYYVDHYRPNTKYFFDKAYLIKKASVPDFLRGHEDDILLCGKYTMLLKSFKPMHPLFSLNMLQVKVCLLHSEIEELKNNCVNYIKKARQKCGPPISVSEVLAEKDKVKRHHTRLAELNAKKNLEKWQSEQELRASEISNLKKQQLMDLQMQILEVEDKKLRQRLQSIELERKCWEEQEEMEMERLNQENEERQKRISYYEELNKMIDEKKSKTERMITDLKSELDGPVRGADDVMAMSVTSDKFTPDEFLLDMPKFPNKKSQNEASESSEDSPEQSPKSGNKETQDREMVKIQNDVVNESYKKQQEEARKLTMKKSDSDILNSNEIISEVQTNRDRILGSALTGILTEDDNRNVIIPPSTPDQNLTEAQKNKLKVLSHEFEYFQIPPAITDAYWKPRTEAERNKRKLMAHEFGIYEEGFVNTPKIVVENVENLTDLQKNRLKIMSHEYGIESESLRGLNLESSRKNSIKTGGEDDFSRNKAKIMGQTIFTDEFLKGGRKMSLNLDTDRARIRRKILESEYNILTNLPNTPNLPDISPMSTGSDFVTDSNTKEDLKLRIENPFSPIPRLGIPNTAIINEKTPECALRDNTKGFQFPDPNESNRSFEWDLSQPFATSFVDDDDELYKSFLDAVLKQTPNFFKLDLEDNAEDEEDAEEDFDLKEFSKKHSELKTIDTTTLTRHLQMSLTLPLSAYLEVLNNEILRIYLKDLDILAHFKSLRNYFFMMDGEFGSAICHGLHKKLEKGAQPSDLLNYHMLHSTLAQALNSSVYGSDPNAERLSFIVQNIPENFELNSPNVLNVLNLSYRVEWPLNLILNPETLEQYGNIFKYLVKVKRISWALSEAFQLLQQCNKTYGSDILRSPEYRHVQLIRHKMSHFIQCLENHITRSAFQASWKRFMEDLKTTQCMEDLYRKHTTYLKRVLFLCLLNKNSVEYYKNVEEIFKVVLKFHKYLKSDVWRHPEDSFEYIHPKYFKMIESEKNFEKLIKYTLYLGNKIMRYNQLEIGEFIYLFNINGYYTTGSTDDKSNS